MPVCTVCTCTVRKHISNNLYQREEEQASQPALYDDKVRVNKALDTMANIINKHPISLSNQNHSTHHRLGWSSSAGRQAGSANGSQFHRQPSGWPSSEERRRIISARRSRLNNAPKGMEDVFESINQIENPGLIELQWSKTFFPRPKN